MTRYTLITKTSGFYGAPWLCNYVNIPYYIFTSCFLMTMPNKLLTTTVQKIWHLKNYRQIQIWGLLLRWKYFHNILPVCFHKSFLVYSEICLRHTRQSDQLRVTFVAKTICHQSRASIEKFSGVCQMKKQDRKIAPLSLPLLYQYHVWKSKGATAPLPPLPTLMLPICNF